MSEGPYADETVTVAGDGVRVEKSFSADEFPVPAVTFRITVDGPDPVQCRLVDDVPDSFPMDRVGFHPDFESENWTAYKDNRVEFERELDPDEELHTVYGIRADDLSDVERFLGEPTVEVVPAGETVDPDEDAIEEILGPDDTEAVREVLAGDRDTVPGLGAENGEGAASQDAVAAAAESAGEPDGDDPDSNDEPEPIELEDPTRSDDVAGGGPEVAEASDDPEPIELQAPDDDGVRDRDVSSEDGDSPGEADDSDDLAATAGESESSPPTESEPDEPEPDEPEPIELEAPGADDGTDEPSPRQIDDDTESAVTPRDPDRTNERTSSAEHSESAEDTSSDDEPVADSESTTESSDSHPDASDRIGSTDAESRSSSATGSVAAALADEIRAGDVADEDLELLRDELELGTPNSVDVRLSRLQSTVEDLAAYTDALEEFLDEEGTAREVLESVQSDLDALSTEVTDLDARIESAADERAAVSERVGEVAGDVDSVEERVAGVVGDVDAVDDRLDGVESDVDSLRTRIGELGDVAGDLATLEADVDTLDTEMGDVRDELADYDARLESLREELESTVAGVEGDVQGIESEIEELKRFRDNLSDAFGT